MTQPNVLVIHTDQQAAWTLGVHGGDAVATPHIDRIGREGAVLQAMHTVCAVCTPSRGCFMTGRYPHQHGAWTNNQALATDEVTWAECLRRAGWRTGYVGKWHLDGDLRPGFVHRSRGFGFEDTRHMFNRGHWKRMAERGDQREAETSEDMGDAETYTTDFLTDRALEFVARADERPFALMLSIPDPHTPFSVREPYASMFDPETMPVPASWTADDEPCWAPRRPPFGGRDEATQDRIRRARAQYLGMVACIDDNVGRLLAALEASGELDRTIVLFTSDHGEYLGEHGLLGKNMLFRSAYHVPAVLRYPAAIAAGTEVAALATQNDLGLTPLAMAGVAPSGREHGRDLGPLLRGEAVAWRDEVHQHHPGRETVGLLTPDWHLVLDRAGDHRLYDLAADPDELHDALHDRGDVAAAMAARILAHHEDTGSPVAAWLRRAVLPLQQAAPSPALA